MTYVLVVEPGRLIPDPTLDLPNTADETITSTLESLPKLKSAQQRYETRKHLSELASYRLSGALVDSKRAENLRKMFTSNGKVQLENYTEPIEFPQVAQILSKAHRALKTRLLSAVYIEKMKINEKLSVLGANEAQRTVTSMLFAEVRGVRGTVQRYLLALWNDADDILTPSEINALRLVRSNAAPVKSSATVNHPRQCPLEFRVVGVMSIIMFVVFLGLYMFVGVYPASPPKNNPLTAPLCRIFSCVDPPQK